MTALLFFCYLQGDWDIEREIIDKSSSLSNAVAQGKSIDQQEKYKYFKLPRIPRSKMVYWFCIQIKEKI